MLEQSRAAGFLGQGPVDVHIEHARALADAIRTTFAAWQPADTRAMDLGSGGGVPGLILASDDLLAARWTFLDAALRRTTFLDAAVESLGLGETVEVVHARAEDAGRDPVRRGAYDLVVARSFGPPAVVAECAAPLLHPGGVLIVSEPPGEGGSDRWPAAELALLGLEPLELVVGPPSFAVICQRDACADRWPRRAGMPAKRPLFR